jgi:ATP-dependent protease HslVU (ClpYQ) peptidase subunit
MTTIVVDKREGIMVSDNQNTIANVPTPCRKILRVKKGPNKGTLVGHIGAPGPCFIFMEWYATHTEHDFSEVMDDNQILHIEEEDDFWCLLLTPDNKILIVDRFFTPEEIPVPYHALGSGGNIALGAMDAGATAQEAVEIACKRDTYSSKMGRPLQVEKI